MDIEGSSLQFSSAGTRPRRGLQIPQACKVDQRPSRTLLPLFPIGSKSETAKKLLRLEVGREFELDECLFIELTGRAMELLETYDRIA